MGTIDFAPLWITLKTGIVASVFSFFIGIAFAELVINTKGRVRAFWDGLLTLPMVLPPTVAGYILLRIFSTRSPFGSFLSNSMGIHGSTTRGLAVWLQRPSLHSLSCTEMRERHLSR